MTKERLDKYNAALLEARKAQELMNKPIAYGNGTSGGVYHTKCWYEHADEYFAERKARAFLGTIYYPGAEKNTLKNIKCERCGKGF